MTFDQIFNSSFLSQVSSFSLTDTLIAQLLAFAIGFCIYFVHKRTYKGVMSSHSFGISLIALSMITALIIQAVTSNVILSLGMVGALSIVRFRTAIKEPMDIAFLFWSLAVGIVLGAGLIPLAVFGSILIGIMLLLTATIKSKDVPYMLVVRCEGAQAEAKALEAVKSHAKKFSTKAKTASGSGVELTLEVRLADNSTEFVTEIAKIPGVADAALVTYNGEFMGG
jgi:uncharacterized membrane protein YhiD involved in acid resistance